MKTEPIDIFSGVYTSAARPNAVESYPRNLRPVIEDTGVSKGFLLPADGLSSFINTDFFDRGGYNWKEVHYRVIGNQLVKISSNGTITSIGTIDGDDYVRFSESFDYLSVSGGNKLYLYNGTTLAQNTDENLGLVLDHVWVDNYFLTTDGANLVVTELNNPFAVNPFKYGSSEIDPDPVVGVSKLRNEVVAVNRYSIEFFSNVGGEFFPFNVIDGAQIEKGSVSKNTYCLYLNQLAFIGSGRNEPLAIYMAVNGSTVKISTKSIDAILATYTEEQAANCLVETKKFNDSYLLYVHLIDRTYVFDYLGGQLLNKPIWYILDSGQYETYQTYKARNFVWCYNQWFFGDPTTKRLGVITLDHSLHFGEIVRCQFSIAYVYNKNQGFLIREAELMPLAGRQDIETNSFLHMQTSPDGVVFNDPDPIPLGPSGDRSVRLVWFTGGYFVRVCTLNFFWNSDAFVSVLSLILDLEGLNV